MHTFKPTLRRQRLADIWEFKVNLGCKVSSRIARATQRNPVFVFQKPKPTKQTKRKPVIGGLLRQFQRLGP